MTKRQAEYVKRSIREKLSRTCFSFHEDGESIKIGYEKAIEDLDEILEVITEE